MPPAKAGKHMVPSDKAFERIKLAIVDEYCKFTTG
jgi:hypothetical protein